MPMEERTKMEAIRRRDCHPVVITYVNRWQTIPLHSDRAEWWASLMWTRQLKRHQLWRLLSKACATLALIETSPSSPKTQLAWPMQAPIQARPAIKTVGRELAPLSSKISTRSCKIRQARALKNEQIHSQIIKPRQAYRKARMQRRWRKEALMVLRPRWAVIWFMQRKYANRRMVRSLR